MSAKHSKLVILLAMGLLLAAAMACQIGGVEVGGGSGGARVGELQNKSETVEVGAADSVDVRIDMAAGELTIGGGAAELLEADFAYNVEEIEPVVTYSDGDLTIGHGDATVDLGSLFQTDDFRNEWDLRFSDEVPMTMEIDFAAGRAIFELGSLALSRLVVDSGAGELEIDLSGQPAVTSLDLSLGAGETTVDLTGDWTADLDATIEGGVGELTVRLPSGVGVRVEASAGLGDVNATGLNRDGDYYVNDAYGESDVTLDITISAGIGEVNLEVQ